MKIQLKIRLKKQHIFIAARRCQMDPEIDEKGGPIKRCISRVSPPKHENLRHFRESIAKLLEKTRVFDVPGPPWSLPASKEPSGPQFGHKMDPTGSSNPRKCGIFAVPSAKTSRKYVFSHEISLLGATLPHKTSRKLEKIIEKHVFSLFPDPWAPESVTGPPSYGSPPGAFVG